MTVKKLNLMEMIVLRDVARRVLQAEQSQRAGQLVVIGLSETERMVLEKIAK